MSVAAVGARRIHFAWVLAFIVGAELFARMVTGCGGTLRTFDEVNDPGDDKSLSMCRQIGRDAKADAGGDGGVGWTAYDRCVRDAGLR